MLRANGAREGGAAINVLRRSGVNGTGNTGQQNSQQQCRGGDEVNFHRNDGHKEWTGLRLIRAQQTAGTEGAFSSRGRQCSRDVEQPSEKRGLLERNETALSTGNRWQGAFRVREFRGAMADAHRRSARKGRSRR